MKKGLRIFNLHQLFSAVKEDLLFLILLLIFCLIRVHSINTPGLYADEIYVPYVGLQTKLQVPSLHPPFITIFGYKLPCGISPQSGGFPIYPQLALLYLTENPFAHRVLSVVYASISIIFFYAFIKSFINKKVALLSILFLTFMPSHIFYSRTDPYFILRLSILSFMFYVFNKWYHHKDWKYFYMGCLVTGLGLSTRLEMVMFVIAFPTYLIFFNKGLFNELVKTIRKNIIRTLNGFFFFILGAIFYILFNILSEYRILNFFEQESILKEGNILSAYLTNIGIRINQIKAYFNCGNPFREIEGSFCSSIPFFVILLSLLMVIGMIIVKRLRGAPNKKLEFLIVISILIFLQSIPSTSLSPFHNLIILPFLVAIFSYSLSLFPKVLSVALTIILIVIYTNLNIQYYKNLNKYLENPMWSSAIFDLVKSLEKEKVKKVIVGDWGVSRLIFFVSKGEIETNEIFGYSKDSIYFLNQMENEYKIQENVYIFYVEDCTGFNRLGAFRKFIKDKEIPYQEMFISNNLGKPVYAIFKLKLMRGIN